MKSIKTIILDTTYVLPIFGFEVNISSKYREEIKQLWENGYDGFKFYLPSVCLIETLYKLLGEYRREQDYDVLDRYQMMLPTVLNSPVTIFNPELDSIASKIATIIRHAGHTDIMDCWIAASAVKLNGILLTEEKALPKILQNIIQTKDLILWSWNDFMNNII